LRDGEEIAGLRTNQVTAAAIFALTAAAAFNLGEKEDAFQFACQAYWRNGIEPFVFAVFQRVLNDFADRGQPRTCPEREDVESFLNRTVPLR
jgi:hypothetical protein